jgi:hypothetical protein
MTKKDYILIARALNNVGKKTDVRKKQYWQAIMDIVIVLGGELQQDNPRFDYSKFVEACNK